MRCPNCNADFSSERELDSNPPARPAREAWYLPAARRRLACPRCGVPLAHRPATLWIGSILGLAFIASLVLKNIYPQSALLQGLFWVCTLALMVCVPLLMRSARRFKRLDQ